VCCNTYYPKGINEEQKKKKKINPAFAKSYAISICESLLDCPVALIKLQYALKSQPSIIDCYFFFAEGRSVISQSQRTKATNWLYVSEVFNKNEADH
jgi:hypothetical protein